MVEAAVDYSGFVRQGKDGRNSLSLAVEGMRCAGCAFKIEKALNGIDGVEARANVTRHRLQLVWTGEAARGNDLVSSAAQLGFKLSPVAQDTDSAQKLLLRCMAVAGFASGNIMVFSLALWFTTRDSMGGATRDLMHWVSAFIALPAVFYAGRPFFRSAWESLRRMRTNMDVPISLAVLLASFMSLFETAVHGEHVYFDSAVMLLFLLLCGRYLDAAARGRARAAAGDLVSLMAGVATVLENNIQRRLPAAELREGMLLMVAPGERILADGRIESGDSTIDTSAITGETVPRSFAKGDQVLGGMLNAGQPLLVRVTRPSGQSLMSDIARLMEKAEQGNAAYVRLADKIAGWYTPVVHVLALMTFSGWIYAGAAWQQALMNAITVLIITCPCALGLAVPVVQMLASQRLFRRGILLKSADALERLDKIDTIVFDKTGTLTTGRMTLTDTGGIPPEDMQLAASLAAHSRHPYSRAVAAAWRGELLDMPVTETPGLGVEAVFKGDVLRLGAAWFAGGEGREGIWFKKSGGRAFRFSFTDPLRADARGVLSGLGGYKISLLSGDDAATVSAVAAELAIRDARGGVNPAEKMHIVDAQRKQGRHVLMVGDGLNDAPSLSCATVSMSPSTALDIAQNAADIVFQGALLAPVAYTLRIARRTQELVRQNFMLSFAYNVIAVPLAVMGHVTPLIAAVAMSSSSLLVIGNALRLNRMEE